MKQTTFQHPELRDANDNIIQQGAFGKNTALANATNDGWIDYVANDLEALYDAQTAANTSISTETLTVSGKTTTGTLEASSATVSGSITTTGLTVTGETSVPTANEGNSSKAIASTEFVAKSLAALVNGAPDQLNTLNELAEALGNDANFSATITAELAKKLNSTEAESTYAKKQEIASTYLPLSGGTLTGVVNGVTPPNGDNSKKLATTEFVNAKAGNYLPLSGGTMTDAIRYVDNGKNFTIGKTANGNVDLCWNWANREGAGLALRSTDYSSPGEFMLFARDANNSCFLTGKPDGSLTWNNQPLLPVGIVQAFAGSTIPTGWLLCDGSAVSRTDYAALFAVIGTTYGSGDGSTTFNLPNLTDKFIQGNSTSGTVKSAGLPNIKGDISFRTLNITDNNLLLEYDFPPTGSFYKTTKSWSGSHLALSTSMYSPYKPEQLNMDASRSSSVYGNSTTVQPPALTMRYIIKY